MRGHLNNRSFKYSDVSDTRLVFRSSLLCFSSFIFAHFIYTSLDKYKCRNIINWDPNAVLIELANGLVFKWHINSGQFSLEYLTREFVHGLFMHFWTGF